MLMTTCPRQIMELTPKAEVREMRLAASSVLNRPVRPGSPRTGTGRQCTVRPRARRRRCRPSELGRGRTERTAVNWFSPSPVVNGRHPWIFRKVHNNIHIKLITITLTVTQDPSASAPSAQCLTPLLQRSIYRFITLTARSEASIANHLNISSNRPITAGDGG